MLKKYIFLLCIVIDNNTSSQKKPHNSFEFSFVNFKKEDSKELRSPTLSWTEKGLFTAGSFFMLFKLLKK